MFHKIQSDEPQLISFLLIPRYSMIALFSAIEPLRIANGLTQKDLFSWQVISEDGGPVTASNDMSLNADAAISDIDNVDSLIVCSSYDPQFYESKTTISWLKKLSRKGAQLGALDTGCHILAKAGLLDDYSVTLHWDAVPSFQEEFPRIKVTDELFEIDRNRFTCAGGTASIDMMLHLISLKHGRKLALEICEQFIYNGIRDNSAKQRIQLSTRLGIHNNKLLKLVETMEQTIAAPLNSNELSQQCNLSTRQVERLFKSHLQTTPQKFYLKLRLERANQLLTQSCMSVMEVALACGFSSASHFSRSYRDHYHRAPGQDRQSQTIIQRTVN